MRAKYRGKKTLEGTKKIKKKNKINPGKKILKNKEF